MAKIILTTKQFNDMYGDKQSFHDALFSCIMNECDFYEGREGNVEVEEVMFGFYGEDHDQYFIEYAHMPAEEYLLDVVRDGDKVTIHLPNKELSEGYTHWIANNFDKVQDWVA
jgi:hypothetical protein